MHKSLASKNITDAPMVVTSLLADDASAGASLESLKAIDESQRLALEAALSTSPRAL